MKAVFIAWDPELIQRFYFKKELIERMSAHAELDMNVIQQDEWKEHADQLKDADVVFTTWGMSKLTEEEIKEYFPKLKAIFYAAGSVQSFARPYLKNDVVISSSWKANAVPVAEHTLALLLLAAKGFFQVQRICKEDRKKSRDYVDTFPGFYGLNIGILGAGMIGRKVIELLKPFKCNVLVYDPFLTDESAAEMGVTKVSSIEEVFEKCLIVSNHIANLPTTQKIITKAAFDKMADNGIFINTGRGQQVVEEDLIAALKEHPNRTAVLDVTWPEPPVAGHPFYSLPNCVLTPHIAGSSGDEVHRMSQYMVQEFRHYTAGEPCLYEVTAEMLKTMA